MYVQEDATSHDSRPRFKFPPYNSCDTISGRDLNPPLPQSPHYSDVAMGEGGSLST